MIKKKATAAISSTERKPYFATTTAIGFGLLLWFLPGLGAGLGALWAVINVVCLAKLWLHTRRWANAKQARDAFYDGCIDVKNTAQATATYVYEQTPVGRHYAKR